VDRIEGLWIGERGHRGEGGDGKKEREAREAYMYPVDLMPDSQSRACQYIQSMIACMPRRSV
jgi:hypothetical protein